MLDRRSRSRLGSQRRAAVTDQGQKNRRPRETLGYLSTEMLNQLLVATAA